MSPRSLRQTFLLIVLLLFLAACQAVQVLTPTPAVPTQTRASALSPSPADTRPPAATPTRLQPTPLGASPATQTAAPPPAPAAQTLAPTAADVGMASSGHACGYSPSVAGLLDQTTPEDWIGWIKRLSGAEPVTVGGKQVSITSRYSVSMFSGQPHALGFEYVKEQVLGWYPPEQVEAQRYTFTGREGRVYTWQNLILTLPGQTRPDERVILSAHLDSTARENPEILAPGAEDNASGSAALLEAARILRGQRFERTLQIVWFTGEEQGLRGSEAFVQQRIPDPAQVVGVVNLDMFGYDPNNDGCFELHVGRLPASQTVGECFTQSIEAYQPGLPYDYLTEHAIHGSDHASFWEAGIGAVEVLENLFDHTQLPHAGCPDREMNPNYHTAGDTYDRLNPQTGSAIVRAALATVIGLALPLP